MNPNEILADLSKEAADYNHSPASYATLEPYREPILLLRAKYASYEIVTEILVSRGIKVSEATVRRFSRRDNTEMKRLRAEWTAKRKAATTPVSTQATLPQSPPSSEPVPSATPSSSAPISSGILKVTGTA